MPPIQAKQVSPYTSEIVVRSDVSSSKSQTTLVQADVSTTDATPTALYAFTPRPSTSVRVYATVTTIASDGSDDYGVDVVASFRVDGAGVVIARLASTTAAPLAGLGIATAPAFDTSAGEIRLMVVGTASAIRWGASISIVERSTAA